MVAVTCSKVFTVLNTLTCKIVPSKGLSEVTGIVVETMLRNTVRLRRIVTPEI